MSLLNFAFVQYGLLPVIVTVLLLLLFVKKFINRQTVQALQKLPGIKLRFYNVLGHLDIRARKMLQKNPLPIHVCKYYVYTCNLLSKRHNAKCY